MKKGALLLPLAASLANLIAGGAEASALTTTVMTPASIEGPTIAPLSASAPLVFQRSNDAPRFAGPTSHASSAS